MSWSKKHYTTIDKKLQDTYIYHYKPFQLTNDILSGLLNRNMRFNSEKSNINFNENGFLEFINFPSLICDKIKKTNNYDPRALNIIDETIETENKTKTKTKTKTIHTIH